MDKKTVYRIPDIEIVNLKMDIPFTSCIEKIGVTMDKNTGKVHLIIEYFDSLLTENRELKVKRY